MIAGGKIHRGIGHWIPAVIVPLMMKEVVDMVHRMRHSEGDEVHQAEKVVQVTAFEIRGMDMIVGDTLIVGQVYEQDNRPADEGKRQPDQEW